MSRCAPTRPDPTRREEQRDFDPRDYPDPRHVAEDDLWDPQANAWVPRPSSLIALLVGLVLGILGGIVLVLIVVALLAAPRAAHPATGDATGSVRGEQLGAPLAAPSPSLSAARLAAREVDGAPSPDVEIGTAIAGGLLAYADPSHGDRYLAIPSGPGRRVRICSSIGLCLERTSTDAGPALSMQRAGRIADVSFVDFAYLCACDPRSVGLLEGSIESLAPGLTPPPTDVGP